MARFRRAGVNWEGRYWRTSPGLNALMDEIEAAYPNPGPGDGTVASRIHDRKNSKSDHRPYPYDASPAVVRAVDAGEYVEDQGITLAEALRKSRDPRIKYVIHEGRMFSSYNHVNGPAWTWRPYTGTVNPHENHAHVSLNSKGDTDGSAWNLNLGDSDMAVVEDIQKALNKAGARDNDGNRLDVDGVWGPKTEAAFINGLNLGSGGGLTEKDVKAIINDSQIVAG